MTEGHDAKLHDANQLSSLDPRAVELVAKEAKRRHRSFEAPGGHLVIQGGCVTKAGW